MHVAVGLVAGMVSKYVHSPATAVIEPGRFANEKKKEKTSPLIGQPQEDADKDKHT